MKTVFLLLLVASLAHRSCHANQNEDAASPRQDEDVVPPAKSADRWESMAQSLNTLKERFTKLSPEYLELLESAKQGILSAKDSLLRHTSKVVEIVGRAVEGWKPDVPEPQPTLGDYASKLSWDGQGKVLEALREYHQWKYEHRMAGEEEKKNRFEELTQFAKKLHEDEVIAKQKEERKSAEEREEM